MEKLFSIISHLQTHYHFKPDFEKVDQHTDDKWSIYGTKHRKDISGKAWNSAVEYPSRESRYDIKESECDMFNP